jgi:hypothetical protein
MVKKREYERRNYTLDKEVIRELEKRKVITGIPMGRQLEISWKKFRKELNINI